MPRVVGCDPGTSGLDLVLLDAGRVVDQASFDASRLNGDPDAFARQLRAWMPIDLVAGPSGYGVPLVTAAELTDDHLDQMTLVRPDERGHEVGVGGFRRRVRELVATGLPAVFLPGGIHLPTIPAHRKANAIDLGTPDKVCVAALALYQHRQQTDVPYAQARFAVVEVGSAFTAVLVIEGGQLVDAAAGSRGPLGVRSGGAWDGEAAYWLAPLSKNDLFRGGMRDLGELGPPAFGESLRKQVAGLKAVTPFARIYLSGVHQALALGWLEDLATVAPLSSLPGARVKHAAQGAALVADGLAGGPHGDLVESLALRSATGRMDAYLAYRRPLASIGKPPDGIASAP
ncbi:MAG: hypothetical protein KatS3mg108_2239 [Isosphaeraceae bacterium]|jgi:predicted butyrate kinase (DUF1464 family)|nr:MAG: hypothetical protein KatS3mg108_2239 [Isosphaeraceae bacterium]